MNSIRVLVDPLIPPVLVQLLRALPQTHIGDNCGLPTSQMAVHLLLRDGRESKIVRAMPCRWLWVPSLCSKFLFDVQLRGIKY